MESWQIRQTCTCTKYLQCWKRNDRFQSFGRSKTEASPSSVSCCFGRGTEQNGSRQAAVGVLVGLEVRCYSWQLPVRPGCQRDPGAFHGSPVGGAAQGVASMWCILLSAHFSYKIRIWPHACLSMLIRYFIIPFWTIFINKFFHHEMWM